MKLVKVLTVYDSEPLELANSLYILIWIVPYFLGGVILYHDIPHGERITLIMICLSIFQIASIQMTSLRLRYIGNLIALFISFHAFLNVDLCIENCSNMYVLCSPVLFGILSVRNNKELNETRL